MTRSNGYNQLVGRDAPASVTVIHRQGADWRVLVVRQSDKGFEIDDAHSIPVERNPQLDQTILEADTDLVIRVLPGGSVICRLLSMPPMEETVLAAALDLQAEGALPSGLDQYRRAAALLPWKGPTNEPVGVAVGWPGRIPEGVEPDSHTRFASESASLLELLALGGDRGVACFVDQTNRSLELVAHEDGQTFVRTARLSDAASSTEIKRLISETTLSAGFGGESLEELKRQLETGGGSTGHRLLVTGDAVGRLKRLVRGVSDDPTWWTHYGVALGAALGSCGPRRPIFELYAEPPKGPQNPLLRAAAWLSEPRRGLFVATIAILCILMAPWLFAMGRYRILQWKARDLEEAQVAYERINEQEDFYRILRQQRWPMTKLLADISLATPPDVQLEVVNIVQGEEILIRGSAPLDSLSVFDYFVPRLQELQKTGVFREVDVGSYKEERGRTSFEITASISEPYVQAGGYENFTPRRVELYGDEAWDLPSGGYIVDSGARSARPSIGASSRSRATLGSGGPGPRTESGADRERRSSIEPRPVDEQGLPAPLTDAEIAGMKSLDEIVAAMTPIARVKYLPNLSESDRQRLNDEYRKLAARRREIIQETTTEKEESE